MATVLLLIFLSQDVQLVYYLNTDLGNMSPIYKEDFTNTIQVFYASKLPSTLLWAVTCLFVDQQGFIRTTVVFINWLTKQES